MKKSGFVAIVGRPNVGKSTLMNRIIGQKIAITSKKPQTTRNQIRTVYTSDEGQIVFVDTPGVIKSKNKLGDYMVGATSSAVKDVDLILWLVEPSDYIGEGDKAIAEKHKNSKVPVVLVINKLDTIKKSDVIIFMDAYRKIMDFAEIVPISAFKGENVDELIKVIFSYLKEGPYFFDEDTITDHPSRHIAAELIREKALRLLDKEIPHGIAVVIDVMQYRKTSSGQGIYDIDATIICERDSHKGIIIGKGGQMLKKIGQDARIDIEKMMETKVNLHLFVKVKNNWRDSDYLVKNFGYKNDDK
jgi:GTP-binding protein Era